MFQVGRVRVFQLIANELWASLPNMSKLSSDSTGDRGKQNQLVGGKSYVTPSPRFLHFVHWRKERRASSHLKGNVPALHVVSNEDRLGGDEAPPPLPFCVMQGLRVVHRASENLHFTNASKGERRAVGGRVISHAFIGLVRVQTAFLCSSRPPGGSSVLLLLR